MFRHTSRANFHNNYIFHSSAADLTFNLAIVDNSVPESVVNAVVIITPQAAVPEQVVLFISSSSGSAIGEIIIITIMHHCT